MHNKAAAELRRLHALNTAELRRLHALNSELLDALTYMLNV
jgi:hypothetical protein